MFRFTPQHISASPFTTNPSAHHHSSCTCHDDHSPSLDFAAFDARRSHLEQLALAQRQRDRRDLEEARHLRQQQLEEEQAVRRAIVEQEVQRRRRAAEEQAVQEELEAQQWIARRNTFLRHQHEQQLQQRAAAIEEHNRRVAAYQQAQVVAARRQQEQQQLEAHPEVDFDLQPLLQLLFGGAPPTSAAKAAPDATPTSVAPQPTSTPAPVEAPIAPTPASAPTTVTPEQPSTSNPHEDHFRSHADRVRALATLNSITSSFNDRQSSFIIPSTLTFQPSPPSSTVDGTTSPSTATPKLAFRSSNAPFLAYEDFLVGLLSKVDEVQSGGDRVVKRVRKELVKRIDSELARLDQVREAEWKKQNEQSEAKDPVPEPAAPAPVEEEQPLAPLLEDSTSAPLDSTPVSDPADTPLPTPDSATTDPTPRLTSEALSSLPSHARSRPSRRASFSSDSTSTLSVDSVQFTDAIMAEVWRQAHKLGIEVQQKERDEIVDGLKGLVVA